MAMRYSGTNVATVVRSNGMRTNTGSNNNTGGVPNHLLEFQNNNNNSNNSSLDEESKKPTMDEVIAMALCYRRLAFVLGTAPTVVAFTPWVVKTALALVNVVTKGYGYASFVLTGLLTWIWYISLKSAAPSPEKLQDAYRKSQGRLPLLMFVGSCVFLRFLAGSSSTGQQQRPNLLQWTPNISWGVGLGPACGLTLVGLAVLLRLVGPSSIVRCSTIPLVSNHALNAIKSKESFLSFVAGPNENGAGDISLNYSDFRLHNYGWRYQWPSSLSGIANVVVITILGYATAEVVFVPYWHYLEADSQGYEQMRRAHSLILCTCILTMILHFGFANLNGTAHELTPKKYYANQMKDKKAAPVLISGKAFMAILSRTILCAMFVPLVCFAPISFASTIFFSLELQYDSSLVALMLFCCIISCIVGLYSAVLDEASKTALCAPGMNLERCVRDANVGRAPGRQIGGAGGTESSLTEAAVESYVIDTMLHSILHGDSVSVMEIRQSTAAKTGNYLDLGRYEAARNTNAVDRMAKVLLGNKEAKRSSHRPERPLEEDILRHSILESIGGSVLSPMGSSIDKQSNSTAIVLAKSIQHFVPSERHSESVRAWVLPSRHSSQLMMNVQGGAIEPKGVVLIRALNAYTGGLGQSLIDASKIRSPYIVWQLPPGAIVASEYAIIALSRCLVTHLQHVKTDWRSSHISMLIAASLSSAYRLRVGIFEYARYRKNLHSPPFNSSTTQGTTSSSAAMDEDVSEQLVKNDPGLSQVLNAIDQAIDAILKQLETTTGSSSSFESVANALADKNCALWIRARHAKAD